MYWSRDKYTDHIQFQIHQNVPRYFKYFVATCMHACTSYAMSAGWGNEMYYNSASRQFDVHLKRNIRSTAEN